MQETKQLLLVTLFLLGIVACKEPESSILLDVKEGDVILEVDSVGMPELAEFPIRFKLSNYTDKKVVLFFESASNEYKHQVNNFYVTAGQDTFNIGLKIPKGNLVFNENSVTSFLGYGYFIHGKGHFDSFKEIEAVFEKGKLEYKLDKKLVHSFDLEEILPKSDTLLIPSKLEASTNQALIVDRFLPGSFWWREERL